MVIHEAYCKNIPHFFKKWEFVCLLREFILFTQYDTSVAGLRGTFRDFEAWKSESSGHSWRNPNVHKNSKKFSKITPP